VDDFRVGTVIRRVRQSRGWRQRDLAERSGISISAISRIERGEIGPQSIASIRAVAGALDIRIDLVPRWRGGDLDRLLNRGHSALHESVARRFRSDWPAWILAPEVTFAVYGERGAIDLLAWHQGRRALLVVELKTDLADLNELLGTFDRKRRLAPRIAAERGWDPATVSAWLIVSDSRTNRRRMSAHDVMVTSALPDDRRTLVRWLGDPVGRVGARSIWTDSRGAAVRQPRRPIRRVRPANLSVDRRPPA
jgi:transcriptional regulator with XRE-family HTH domain